MNAKEYINSGIVESYVLGLATDAERQEFEQLCAAHREIAEARTAFESSLENSLLLNAAPPPVAIKEKFLAAISVPGRVDDTTPTTELAPVRRMNPWKWVAAASLLVMAALGYWAFTANERYRELEARQTGVQSQLREAQNQVASLQEQADLVRKPMQIVSLKGTDVAPEAQATVYWDTTGTRDVYMVINNLPRPASEKQYQLWAMLDGKPIDLGVFDYEVEQKRLIVRMKNVQNAQAFAISLEKKGGSSKDTPEGQIYVMGNL